MVTRKICGTAGVWASVAVLAAGVSRAEVLQVGGGGTTAPGAWTSGAPVSNVITALTVVPANFGALYDSASGRVGGGTVAGDLYYAFTARSLDRAGDTRLPTNSVAGYPYSPDTSFAGGQLLGAEPSLSVSQAYGNYAFGYNIGTNGLGPNTFFNNPRVDLAPARVALFEVHLHFNASGNDTASITMRLYDNLPAQRQPVATDVASHTQTLNTASSDFAFDAFQFISGHADTRSTRWHFSNVVFAENAGEASNYLLTHPDRALDSVIQIGRGGTNAPGAWTSGPAVSNCITALTVDAVKFGELYDGGSGLVGGNAVAGDLYYAFTARSLDRAGDTLLPPGSAANSPYSPGTSYAGGQLVGAAPSLGVGQHYGNWALGCFLGGNGGGSGEGGFSPRIDMAPARVSLFDVRVHFNASGNDTAIVVMYTYDNLPSGQLQPCGTNTPTYMRQLSLSGDFAFKTFQFVAGHADTAASTRWLFSDVVFARNATAAAEYLLNPPPPPRGTALLFR